LAIFHERFSGFVGLVDLAKFNLVIFTLGQIFVINGKILKKYFLDWNNTVKTWSLSMYARTLIEPIIQHLTPEIL